MMADVRCYFFPFTQLLINLFAAMNCVKSDVLVLKSDFYLHKFVDQVSYNESRVFLLIPRSQHRCSDIAYHQYSCCDEEAQSNIMILLPLLELYMT